jgi:hypothetical protein
LLSPRSIRTFFPICGPCIHLLARTCLFHQLCRGRSDRCTHSRRRLNLRPPIAIKKVVVRLRYLVPDMRLRLPRLHRGALLHRQRQFIILFLVFYLSL